MICCACDQLGRDRHGQLEHGLIAGRRGFLREKSDRRALLDRDRAGIRRSLAEDEREERRFARAIRADQADAIAAIHLERHILEEDAPGERFGDLGNGEHGAGAHSPGSGAALQVRPVRPNEKEERLLTERRGHVRARGRRELELRRGNRRARFVRVGGDDVVAIRLHHLGALHLKVGVQVEVEGLRSRLSDGLRGARSSS